MKDRRSVAGLQQDIIYERINDGLKSRYGHILVHNQEPNRRGFEDTTLYTKWSTRDTG